MNFCKDCKHYRETEEIGYRICIAERLEPSVNLVTGRKYPKWEHILWQGGSYETCGNRRHRMPDCPDFELYVAEPRPRKWWQVWRAK